MPMLLAIHALARVGDGLHPRLLDHLAARAAILAPSSNVVELHSAIAGGFSSQASCTENSLPDLSTKPDVALGARQSTVLPPRSS
jgi:hypothetical protein